MDAGPSQGSPTTAKVVKATDGYLSLQGSMYHPGISVESVGSKNLWLGVVTLSPGQRTSAHVHASHETAFFMMSGSEVELWSGDDLQSCQICRPGDYLYIPANVLHVAVNRGREVAVFIGSRNDPTARESMIFHPEMDSKVP